MDLSGNVISDYQRMNHFCMLDWELILCVEVLFFFARRAPFFFFACFNHQYHSMTKYIVLRITGFFVDSNIWLSIHFFFFLNLTQFFYFDNSRWMIMIWKQFMVFFVYHSTNLKYTLNIATVFFKNLLKLIIFFLTHFFSLLRSLKLPCYVLITRIGYFQYDFPFRKMVKNFFLLLLNFGSCGNITCMGGFLAN